MQTLQLKTETKHYVKNDGDGVALSHWASGQKRGMQGKSFPPLRRLIVNQFVDVG